MLVKGATSEGNLPMNDGSPSHRASNAESVSIPCRPDENSCVSCPLAFYIWFVLNETHKNINSILFGNTEMVLVESSS